MGLKQTFTETSNALVAWSMLVQSCSNSHSNFGYFPSRSGLLRRRGRSHRGASRRSSRRLGRRSRRVCGHISIRSSRSSRYALCPPKIDSKISPSSSSSSSSSLLPKTPRWRFTSPSGDESCATPRPTFAMRLWRFAARRCWTVESMSTAVVGVVCEKESTRNERK